MQDYEAWEELYLEILLTLMSTNNGLYLDKYSDKWMNKSWSSICLYQNFFLCTEFCRYIYWWQLPLINKLNAYYLPKHSVRAVWGRRFKDTSRNTVISLANVHRILMHSILLTPSLPGTTIVRSERENYVGNISKEHKSKIITGLRKESEPNPALVHGDPAWLIRSTGVRSKCLPTPQKVQSMTLMRVENSILFFLNKFGRRGRRMGKPEDEEQEMTF